MFLALFFEHITITLRRVVMYMFALDVRLENKEGSSKKTLLAVFFLVLIIEHGMKLHVKSNWL